MRRTPAPSSAPRLTGSATALIRRSLRIVAAQYYSPRCRRPPKVRLFVCTDPNLGQESDLYCEFRD